MGKKGNGRGKKRKHRIKSSTLLSDNPLVREEQLRERVASLKTRLAAAELELRAMQEKNSA